MDQFLNVVGELVGIIGGPLATFLIGWVAAARKSRTNREVELAEKQDALRAGMLAIMRANLMDAYERHVLHGVPLSVARRECIDKEHAAYKANGGNSTGDAMYEAISNLPTYIVGDKEDR